MSWMQVGSTQVMLWAGHGVRGVLGQWEHSERDRRGPGISITASVSQQADDSRDGWGSIRRKMHDLRRVQASLVLFPGSPVKEPHLSFPQSCKDFIQLLKCT